MNVDDIFRTMGEFGCYQKFLLLLWGVCGILVAMQSVCYVFTSATPTYRCYINGCDNDTTDFSDDFVGSNGSVLKPFLYNGKKGNFGTCISLQPNATLLRDHLNRTTQICAESHLSSFVIQPCDRWIFDKSVFTSTVVTQWNLVCSQELLVPLAESVLMAGMAAGSLVFGSISDRFGRKTAGIIGISVGGLLSIVVPFLPYYGLLVFVRFLAGACFQGAYQGSFVINCEFFGESSRMLTGTVLNIFFAFGEMILGTVAYFIRDWKTLFWAISSPCILWTIVCWFSLESPRWLIMSKRYEEGKRAFEKMAACNGTTIPKHMLQLENFVIGSNVTDVQTAVRHYSPLDLLSHSKIRAMTLILLYNWFLMTMSYYGISMAVPPIGKSQFFSFIIITGFEIPGYLFNFIIVNHVGRRLAFVIEMLLSGFAGVATAFVSTNADLYWLYFTLVIIGKFGCAAGFGNFFIYTTELFPTVVRNSGTGLCVMMGHFGAILSSYVVKLELLYPALPLIVFGASSLVGGFCVMFLPETMGGNLLDTLEEMEDVVIGIENIRNLLKGTCWSRKTSMANPNVRTVESTKM